MTSTDSRTILFVVGVHRSGTSALCAALAACGASFGTGLIDAMSGVNDEGFWEDAALVELNEQLLSRLDSSWYALSPQLADVDWSDECFNELRQRGVELLQRGFGGGNLEAVKDPRLCLTLPFWLSLCAELGIATRICVSSRAPLEVARSLEKRDGFPLGYGLRLYAGYRSLLEASLPAKTLQVSYDDLLRDTPAVMARLAQDLPIAAQSAALADVVREDLRHQASESATGILCQDQFSVAVLTQLQREIEEHYPADATLREFARTLVDRGLELSRVGEAHSAALATLDQRDADVEALAAEHRQALATLDERDADIAGLSAEHQAALATISERDEQIREFDRRLAALGEEHSHALEVLRKRDAQLAVIKKVPGVGFVLRRLAKNAQG